MHRNSQCMPIPNRDRDQVDLEDESDEISQIWTRTYPIMAFHHLNGHSKQKGSEQKKRR